MKTIMLFFLLFFVIGCIGQSRLDTNIQKNRIQVLKKTIDSLNEKIKFQEYNNRITCDIGKIDTTLFGKDSSIILFKDKKGIVIKSEKLIYKKNISTDSVVTFYNRLGLIEYGEKWNKIVDNIGKISYWHQNFKYRNEYDSENRLIKYVFFTPTPVMKRQIYSYDLKGNMLRMIDNSSFEFWD